MKHTSRGFTVIELLIVVAILAAASIIFFVQKNGIEVAARDEQRKTAINAMYYSVEEVYFKQNGAYPRTLDGTTIPSVDVTLLSDPQGVKISESNSDYRYEVSDCDGDKCKRYTLRTTLENEDDFVRTSRNK